MLDSAVAAAAPEGCCCSSDLNSMAADNTAVAVLLADNLDMHCLQQVEQHINVTDKRQQSIHNLHTKLCNHLNT